MNILSIWFSFKRAKLENFAGTINAILRKVIKIAQLSHQELAYEATDAGAGEDRSRLEENVEV